MNDDLNLDELLLLCRRMPPDRCLTFLRALELFVDQGVSFEIVARAFYRGCNDPDDLIEARIAELARRHPEAFRD